MTTIIQPKWDFVKYNESENCIELYADHHMLSALRRCGAYFVESILNRSIRGRSWPFDFGIWLHACVEYMYTPSTQRILQWNKMFGVIQVPVSCVDKYCSVQELVEFGAEYWKKMDFALYHYNHTQYKAYQGFNGAMKMLLDYHKMYGEDRERYKIVGTECSFGQAKEVPLGEFDIDYNHYIRNDDDKIEGFLLFHKVKCFYSGRIDIIVDDGLSVGVMDTKTRSKFTGYESTDFTPHDGMQGYVFALRYIMDRFFPDNIKPRNRMIINHIQVSDCKDYHDRFKRTPITYTHEQLEEWRLRQLRTFKRLYELVVLGETPDWNTEVCSHFFYSSDCPYKELHRTTPSQREMVRKANYVTIEKWNPAKEDGFYKESSK